MTLPLPAIPTQTAARCEECGRPIRLADSVGRRVGPVCWRRLHPSPVRAPAIRPEPGRPDPGHPTLFDLEETMTDPTRPTAQQILDTPMAENDSGADTVRGYLTELLVVLWDAGEDFSGKRPFGNSGWQDDLHVALGQAGYIRYVEDGYCEDVDTVAGHALIARAIVELGDARPDGAR
jgi:hypothetical protein